MLVTTVQYSTRQSRRLAAPQDTPASSAAPINESCVGTYATARRSRAERCASVAHSAPTNCASVGSSHMEPICGALVVKHASESDQRLAVRGQRLSAKHPRCIDFYALGPRIGAGSACARIGEAADAALAGDAASSSRLDGI